MARFKLDLEQWRSDEGDPAKVAKPANLEPTLAALAGLAALPAEARDGLALLSADRPPKGIPEAAWSEVVTDALGLVGGGWATNAVALGWGVLDLFGAVTDPDGDPHCDGLAVKLRGRKVLAMCASFATVADGETSRAFLYRGDTTGARLLWTLGRGHG